MDKLHHEAQSKVGLENSVDGLHHEAQFKVGLGALWMSCTLRPSLK